MRGQISNDVGDRANLNALAGLAQESRLAIFRLLVGQGPNGLAAGTIAERLGIVNATLSFHLKELTRAGLVIPNQSGSFIYYSANYATMNALIAYLTENCCQDSKCKASGPATKHRRKAA
ncbi:transcriptional repressor SdpR [mine drainage metagenome]|uniref:Transcriptional repressor SdpR n=1 Tax=mine drainage metagenome TaxID=410659 RepID=A0A1J5R7R5_9ZZZZ